MEFYTDGPKMKKIWFNLLLRKHRNGAVFAKEYIFVQAPYKTLNIP